MLIRKKLPRAVLAITAVLFAACTDSSDPVVVTRIAENTPTPFVTPAPEEPEEQPTPSPTPIPITEICSCVEEPDPRVTFNGYSLYKAQLQTLDPQLAEDPLSIDYIENLFVQLTNYDPLTNEIVPEAAESWEISEDGRLYTFHLRTDIPWAYHSPVTEETTQEIDEQGYPRFVTAHDFAYGIRRACHPHTNSYYSSSIAPLIVGCEAVLDAENPDNISQELINAIGVNAIDEATLTIELNAPASHFLSMTPMAIMSATPSWTIEEHGETWTEHLKIVTNGRYVLNAWIHNVYTELIRNPIMPMDMGGSGNIVLHMTHVVPDNDTGYDSWLDNHFDLATIPFEELESHLAEFPDQTFQIPSISVYYISFRMTKPPFDNVHVRRALSAAFDRTKFVSELLQDRNLPSNLQSPPGVFSTSSIDEIGVGFDPEYARAELAAAGYPNCENFPTITLMTIDINLGRDWAKFAEAQWSEHLGCDADQISFRYLTHQALVTKTDPNIADELAPHMFTFGWGPNYPYDANWVGDTLVCENGTALTNRACNEIDDLLVEAEQEIDPTRRIELYTQIKDAFFGPNGEHPIIPIWTRQAFQTVQSWYNYTPISFYGDQWYNDTIEMEAKRAAQGW